MPLDIVTSNKGGQVLLHKGFSYHRHKSGTDSKQIWRCVNWHVSKCLGRIHTRLDEIVKCSDNHNHVEDATEQAVRHVRNQMKHRAQNTQEAPQEIIATAVQAAHVSVQARLPPKDSLKRTIRRQRTTLLVDFDIPEEYSKFEGVDFVIYDDGRVEDRMVIFSTARNLDLLATAKHIFADGTFKVTPQPFEQLYTIHAIKYERNFPLVFALLPNRREETYDKMLNVIRNLCPSWAPELFIFDFEMAAGKAFKAVFPTIKIHGCFVHFCQVMNRHITGEIREKYVDVQDTDFSMYIRHLPALAFVPKEKVIECYETLIASEWFDQREDLLTPLLNYFEGTWIGTLARVNHRRAPMFPIEMWNCYELTQHGILQINNAIEGWRQSFSSLIPGDHPSMWTFIDAIKLEQVKCDAEIEQCSAEIHPPLTSESYKKREERILTVVSNFHNRGTMDYLCDITHNFNLCVL